MSTQNKPTAVLLMAYGTPENTSEVEDYLKDIRRGRPVTPEMVSEFKQRYESVGGKTPLTKITNDQKLLLQQMLNKECPGQFKVFIGMKHWHPYIKDTIKQIHDEGITEIIAIALAPHYSKLSIGGYQTAIDSAISDLNAPINLKLIESWCENKFLIECISKQLSQTITSANITPENIRVIFTAHSLPEKIREWNDPYESQLNLTAKLVAAKTNIPHWQFSFQSAGSTGDKWLGPDINDVLLKLKDAGVKNIVICSVGFVSDNLEIIYDLDIESQTIAKNNGLNLIRVPMRNTEDLFIKALYNIVTGKE